MGISSAFSTWECCGSLLQDTRGTELKEPKGTHYIKKVILRRVEFNNLQKKPFGKLKKACMTGAEQKSNRCTKKTVVTETDKKLMRVKSSPNSTYCHKPCPWISPTDYEMSFLSMCETFSTSPCIHRSSIVASRICESFMSSLLCFFSACVFCPFRSN